MNPGTGKWLIISGIVIVLAGMVIYFFHDKFHWIGHLPGDIRIEKDNFRLFIPVTTMILFSLILSLILFLVRKFM
jgi:hypothetical protein